MAIGASRDDPLTEIPSGVVIGFVDHRWAPLPDEPQECMAATRRDKGLRVAAALRAAQPRGHVMVVDWDDLVSPRLAAWVSAHPRAHGWYGESAYVFNEGPLALRIPAGAHRLFGSTIIQRWDLARAPARTAMLTRPGLTRCTGRTSCPSDSMPSPAPRWSRCLSMSAPTAWGPARTSPGSTAPSESCVPRWASLVDAGPSWYVRAARCDGSDPPDRAGAAAVLPVREDAA